MDRRAGQPGFVQGDRVLVAVLLRRLSGGKVRGEWAPASVKSQPAEVLSCIVTAVFASSYGVELSLPGAGKDKILIGLTIGNRRASRSQIGVSLKAAIS